MTKQRKKLDHLSLTVKYRVGYRDIEIPEEVYKELKNAHRNGDVITMYKYPEAHTWMSSHVRESDCFDWEADIDQFIHKKN